MDHTDMRILEILRGNARISNVELARTIGLAPSAVLERVRKLERQKIIVGYEARVDQRKLGNKLQVIVALKTGEAIGNIEIGLAVAKFPEITQVYEVSGKYSYLLNISVEDTDALRELMCRVGEIPGVLSSETTLVLKSIKEGSIAEQPQGKKQQ